jgi:hypothetical protein
VFEKDIGDVFLRKMSDIKKEWNDAAESWVEFVRKGKDYYRDELNNPAAFELIVAKVETT